MVIFLVALAVRLIHVWHIHDSPFSTVLMGDARGYDEWARQIARGDWLGREVFYQAPLYPYFLGSVYAVAGRDLMLVRVCQAVIGSLSCVLLGLAGRRLFSARTGLIAGLILAFYAPAVFFDGLIQKSVLDVFFVCAILALIGSLAAERPRGRLWVWLGLGLATGALSLTRENALVFAGVLIVFALVDGHRGRRLAPLSLGRRGKVRSLPHEPAHVEAPGRYSQVKTALAPAAAFALGVALVLLPIAIRNRLVGGEFFVTTSQFGPNFFIGNNERSDGTYMPLRVGRGAPEYERQDATELAEYALKRRLTPAEVSRYWTDRALSFVTGSPGDWLALMARKAALLVNTSEMLDTESQESHAEVSWPLRVLGVFGHFGVLVPVAGFGLWVSWPDRRRLWPIYAMLAAYAASVVAFYVFARYRFPLVPFLLLLAAAGVVAVPAWMRSADRWRLVRVGGALAIVAAVVNRPMLSPARMRAITDTNLGTAFYEGGRLADAEARYRRAIEAQPDYAPAFNNLGVTERAQGRLDEAIRSYQEGLAHASDYPDLHYNLANALIAQGRPAEAAEHLKRALAASPMSAASHNNLGMALAAQGRLDEAVVEFRAAIAVDPDSALTHRNLGNALATLGRRAEALISLTRAAELAPSDAAARYDLGSMLLVLQRFGQAEAEFRAALQVGPENVKAINNLGIALASQGRVAEALTQFDRAVELEPGFVDALKNRAMARQALGK